MSEDDSEEGVEQTPENDNDNQEENSNSSSSRNLTLSIRTVMIGVFALGLAVGFSGGVLTSQGSFDLTADTDNNQDSQEPTETNNQEEDTETIDMNEIEMEGEPILGEEDAEVTMVVYEDFQCPYCKRFEENAFQQIKSNYVDSGQLKVVWKDRPIPQLGHDWAEPAAAAMECVYRQNNDAFWKVKDVLFSQAMTLTRGEDEFTADNIQSRIIEMSSKEGVSGSAVQTCIDNDNPMKEVNSDSKEAERIGATGTPTMFINGEKIVGAQPYSNFESVIENALS